MTGEDGELEVWDPYRRNDEPSKGLRCKYHIGIHDIRHKASVGPRILYGSCGLGDLVLEGEKGTGFEGLGSSGFRGLRP